jgi:hypothetical protein
MVCQIHVICTAVLDLNFCGRSRASAGMKTLLLSLVVLGMISGCAHVEERRPPYTGPTDPLAKVVADINANNSKIKTLRAKHSFVATLVDDKGKSRTFSGDGYLLFAKPDNLLLTAGGIIKYFEIGSNDTRYWFTAFPDEVSTQWWGEKSKLTDQGARQIPIRPDLLLEVLGVSEINTNFLQPPAPVMRFNNDAWAYMFVWNKRLPDRWAAEKEVWYDVVTKLPKLVLLFDANGRVILRAYLSEPKEVEGTGAKMQSKYDLYFPESKSQMSFQLTEIKESIDHGRIKIPNPGSFAFPEEPGVKKQIEIQ